MAGIVSNARIESRSARARLKRGRQPHWKALQPKIHIGYCKSDRGGRWVLRRYIGDNKYRISGLGVADDSEAANGESILSYEQAEAAARAMVSTGGKLVGMTVRQAMQRYIDSKRDAGGKINDIVSRTNVHILPTLGDLVVEQLDAETLRRWRDGVANTPPQSRPKNGKPVYRKMADTDDAMRARRASANRILAMLKGALNMAYDAGHVASRDAWGRKVKPFQGAVAARSRHLNLDEAARLLNAADPIFRPLLRAALETGARYSELARLQVADFNTDAGTLVIRQSKAKRSRHIILTKEAAEFFRRHCLGRAGHELMFHRDGRRWGASNQQEPTRLACQRGKITPPISFHILRHTWASLAVMNGVPLIVVAQSLGHRDTTMVERHYGHLATSFVSEAIHAGAPRYAVNADSTTLTPIRGRKRG